MNEKSEYNSISDRIKSAQPRVHSDLIKSARERLSTITSNPARVNSTERYNLPERSIDIAIRQTFEDVGTSPIKKTYSEEFTSTYGKHHKIITEAPRNAVLAYIENLLESVYQTNPNLWAECQLPPHNMKNHLYFVRYNIADTVEKINIVLETEGILWQLEMEDSDFNFYPVGSELMQDSDQKLSVIAQGKKWKNVISPYNEAYNQYLDRSYDRTIPEKLYNSIEELARTICVDLEEWEENREQNLSVYLEIMREKGLFEPNNIMLDELKDITNAVERAFQKAGAERKNRHSEIDREYATLLLHQISAYLTYIIRQYEEKYVEEDVE